MEYQKIINLLDNTPNQSSKFGTISWVEIRYHIYRMYNTNSHIKFKPSILKSSLCNYGDAYILFKGIISIAPLPPAAENSISNDNDKVVFTNYAPLADCKSDINNKELDSKSTSLSRGFCVRRPRQYNTTCWKLDLISGFFVFPWLIVLGRRSQWIQLVHCRRQGIMTQEPNQIPDVSRLFHHSLHFDILLSHILSPFIFFISDPFN